jgi:hypothetical protein
MDATDRARALSVWSRATFRATTFVACVVFLSHRTYGLRNALRSSNTAFGLAAFAVLWIATVLATVRQERGFLPNVRGDSVAMTVVAGGLNGLFVLAALIAAAVGRVMLAPPGPGRPVLAVPLLILFGPVFAFTIGVVVAVPFALVEAVIEDFVDRLCCWADQA